MPRPLGWPLHPFLLSLLVPAGVLARNAGFFAPEDALRTCLALAAVALLALALAWLALRRLHLAALIASGAVVCTWPLLLLGGWSAVLLAGAVLAVSGLVHWRVSPVAGGLVANLFAAGLLALPLAGLAAHLAWQGAPMPELLPDRRIEAPGGAAPAALPNIVHIVADGYAADAVLAEVMQFDNGGFGKALRDLGFVVFDRARTPYNNTLLTMAAVFNAGHPEPGRWPLDLEDIQRVYPALGRAASAGSVRAFLAGHGYRFLAAESGFVHLPLSAGPLLAPPPEGGFRFNLFEDHLLARSALAGLYRRFDRATGGRHAVSGRIDRLLRYALETDLLAGQAPPYLLYLHLMAPHPPFSLDREGRATLRWSPDFAGLGDGDYSIHGLPELRRAYVEGYTEKLRYLNRALIGLLPRLVSRMPAPRVVILHGDHGSGSRLVQDDAAATCAGERFRPYLAVHASEPALRARLEALSREPFNLVNLYRVILDESFGTGLGLLADRSAFAPWHAPWRLTPVDRAAIEAPCPTAVE
jgi:hypothetical protein